MRQLRTVCTIAYLLTLVLGWVEVDAESPCFAYLQDGDVYADCGKDSLRLTTTGDLTDFAITDDGSALAIEREFTIARTRDSVGQVGDCEIQILSLSSNAPPRTINHSCGSLYATCGSILLEQRTNGVEDLIAGKTVRIAGYQRFVCDSKRTVVAGWPGDGNQSFSVGKDSIRQIAEVAGGASVSPSGIVSYFTEASNRNQVCELSRGGGQLCLNDADAFDRISVSDFEEILFTTHTDGGCLYHNYKVTKVTPPGTGNDQCLGIAIWKPSSGKAVVKELAKHPQWLTSQAAEALKSSTERSRKPSSGSN